MNLILFEESECCAGGHVTVTDVRARHIRSVLNAVPGQVIRVGLVNGPLGTGVVRSAEEGHVTLDCTFEKSAVPRPDVDLLLALPRPKVMRRLWAQLAAIGVHRILLTNAERVERNYFDTHVITEACYRPLLIEGLQQARDTRLPIVTVHRQFRKLVEDELEALSDAEIKLTADPGGPAVSQVLRAPSGGTSPRFRVLVAVGPEGGWNSFERSLLGAHGFRTIGIGPRTLRTDTACIALLSLIHAELADPPSPIRRSVRL